MTTTTVGPVLIDDDAAVRTVTVNRPEKRYAIDIELLECEAACQSGLFDTDDFAKGIAAFREKRRPNFGDKQGEQP